MSTSGRIQEIVYQLPLERETWEESGRDFFKLYSLFHSYCLNLPGINDILPKNVVMKSL